jgi:hypothetical protein
MSTSPTSSEARHRSPRRTIRPPSIRWRTISSRKKGLPSARSRICSRTRSGRASTDRSRRTSVPASSALSGSIAIEETLRWPPPHPGRLWPRRAHEQDRADDPVGQVLEQVEQRGVGPVDVLDHGHDRRVGGERREERPPRRVHLVSNLSRLEVAERRGGKLQPDGVGDRAAGPRGVDRGVGLENGVAGGLDLAEHRLR